MGHCNFEISIIMDFKSVRNSGGEMDRKLKID